MNKKVRVGVFTISYMLGIVAFLTDNIILLSLLTFIALVFCIFKTQLSEKFAIAVFLIFALGVLNTGLRVKNFDFLTTIAPHNDVTVVGKVVSIPSTSYDDYTKFYLKAKKIKFYNGGFMPAKAKTLVTLSAPKNIYQNIEIGDTLSLTGRITTPKTASNPSEFCYSTYLKLRNIHSRLFVEEENFSVISKPKNDIYAILSNLNRTRNKILNIHAQNVKSPELELLGGIVFGDDAVVPTEDMKKSFQNSGLTHIIAASGMNVSMIFGMWAFLSKIIGFNYRISILTGIFAIVCYTCMTGFGPPVLRASLMLILILLGKLINKKADSVNLLFVVAFLMLLISPAMITNIGFQLSFAVTFGLLLTYPLIFKNIKNKFLNVLASFVIVPVIAQIIAAPIQMFYFNSFSPYSVLANIAVVPTLGFVSFGGFISCIFALIKPTSYVSVKVFDFLLMPFLTFITKTADFFSNLPYSNITVPSPSHFTICLYYLLILSIFALFLFNDRKNLFIKTAIVSLTVLLISLIPFGKNHNEIIFFSVENADSALIQTSKNKYIMIDTGKAPYKKFSPAAVRIIQKFFEDKGIDTLDMVVLTHFDSDHAGGTPFITEKINVKELVVRTDKDDAPLALEIYKDAKEKDIKIKVPKFNEVLYDDGENKLYAIYTEKGDDNDTSIINIFETPNGKVLFTGDSGMKTFSALKNYLPEKVTVFKSPHHGAKDTISDEYLNKINPDYAIISTGFNIYGHPDKATLDLFRKHNVKILRTDTDNAVKVVMHKNKILLYSYNNRHKKFEKVKNDKKS